DNPFIFALPGFDGTRYHHLEACALMRHYSTKCNAKYPERLRATELRKHFATTVASLKIDECQIYDVSNFMGHAEQIHRDHFRQTIVTRDVCGVSQILEVASGVN
ncbi:GSCOCG00011646001-RA-CDS, partial [Cotesia congregata]